MEGNYLSGETRRKFYEMFYNNIVENCKFPNIGLPTCDCKECSFNGSPCLRPAIPGVVGCDKGWNLTAKGN